MTLIKKLDLRSKWITIFGFLVILPVLISLIRIWVGQGVDFLGALGICIIIYAFWAIAVEIPIHELLHKLVQHNVIFILK